MFHQSLVTGACWRHARRCRSGRIRITYTATDQDGDTASLSFTITVEKDTEPAAPDDRQHDLYGWRGHREDLPDGSGGNGTLTYDLDGGDFRDWDWPSSR